MPCHGHDPFYLFGLIWRPICFFHNEKLKGYHVVPIINQLPANVRKVRGASAALNTYFLSKDGYA